MSYYNRRRLYQTPSSEEINATAAALDLMADYELGPEDITATGAGGRIIKADVIKAINEREAASVRMDEEE